MYKLYVEAILLIERVHRHFLELVKLELDRLGIRDINNVEGLVLFHIGDAEMTIGELMWRGCYLGSNVVLQPQESGNARSTIAGRPMCR